MTLKSGIMVAWPAGRALLQVRTGPWLVACSKPPSLQASSLEREGRRRDSGLGGPRKKEVSVTVSC